MIVSNEPGYYKEGAYGIRIENLQVVTEAAAGRRAASGSMRLRDPDPGADRPRLVEPALLTAEEIAQLDAYHARVREDALSGRGRATGEWLVKATAPIGYLWIGNLVIAGQLGPARSGRPNDRLRRSNPAFRRMKYGLLRTGPWGSSQ